MTDMNMELLGPFYIPHEAPHLMERKE